MSNRQQKCFHIFYTKDIAKKKKTYKQGLLVLNPPSAKIYDEDGQLVTSFKNKQQVVIDQQYTINHNLLITVQKQGNIQEFHNGTIFTKKDIIVLPVRNKKKNVNIHGSNNNSNSNSVGSKTRADDMVQTGSGLNIQRKLYQSLRPHQQEGVQFMHACVMGKKNNALSGCILADYMGLGKTLQTLAFCYSMLRQKQIKKFTIVCPLTLLDVWQKQTKKWLEDKLTPLVCIGDSSESTNIVNKFVNYQYRMLIISYESFYRDMDKLSGKCDMIIFDEGHRMKNKKSKLLLKLKVFRCQKRILLTGTPIQNNLQQLYTCISIINPRIFGNESIFKNVFQKPILQGLAKKATNQQKQLARQRTAQLARQLKQFSLRRTADVLKKFLPPKYQHLIFFTLTNLQNIWYERILKTKSQRDEDMFKTLNQLRKMFIHPNILKMNKANKGDFTICNQDCSQKTSYKIQFTLKIAKYCQNNQQKCVIVSYYTQTLDFVGQKLKQIGVGYTKLDGRQRVQQRKQSILKFQRDTPILLLSGKAGGTGLTLTCAARMVMIEPDWNPSNDSQVMGRIWRQGQTKQVHIYRLLIASTFQQKMLQRQGLKKVLSNNLIDNKQQYEAAVDFENMGKLFVVNKAQVLTYNQKQNNASQFIKSHEQVFPKICESGIIFIKTNCSAMTVNKNNENSKGDDENNQFMKMGIQNFIEKQKGQQQEGEECYDQDDEEKLQEIQKVKIKLNNKKQQKLEEKQTNLYKNQQQSIKQKFNLNADKTQQKTDQQTQNQKKEKPSKLIIQNSTTKLTNIENQNKQIVKNERNLNIDGSQQKIILHTKNSKTDITKISGPLNLLKKIIKK